MKKCLLSLLLMLCCGVASAQIEFGARGGLNLCNAVVDGYDGSLKTSFYLGVTAEYDISDSFAISPELVYSRDGSKTTSDGSDINYRNNYLMVPVLVKYEILPSLQLEAGPQLGVLINASTLVDGERERRYSANPVQFLLAFGATYMVCDHIGVQGRYIHGVSHMGKLLESKSRGGQLGLVYKF